jgi:hypothetical protein
VCSTCFNEGKIKQLLFVAAGLYLIAEVDAQVRQNSKLFVSKVGSRREEIELIRT